MNLLMVGTGKGSWEMRGIQLGAALGARVTSSPTAEDVRWADVVVLIKKHAVQWAPLVQKYGKPIVWDALDCWKQPAENHADERQALAILRAQMNVIKPALVIGATEAQARAAGGVYLPHHSWRGLTPVPAREVVSTVGYEGNALYLGRWRQAIEQECKRRGWTFVINPPDLRACDLLVAFRDGPWDGWICREWKSGVKIVNALAAGRPIITQPSAAWREIIPMAEAHDQSISDPKELSDAFDFWPDAMRHLCASNAPIFAAAYTLQSVAAQYRSLLESKVQTCAA